MPARVYLILWHLYYLNVTSQSGCLSCLALPTQPTPRMQADSAALELRKDAVVLGTYESAAFILSLRDREEFSTTTSFGYHRIPHIGKARYRAPTIVAIFTFIVYNFYIMYRVSGSRVCPYAPG